MDTVCLRNISINTVHKGDDDDYDDDDKIIITIIIKQYAQTEKLQQIGQIFVIIEKQ